MSIAICGEGKIFPARIVGCGKPIETIDELYRCTHCGIPFHKDCAETHFRDDNILTQEHIDSLSDEEVDRAYKELHGH